LECLSFIYGIALLPASIVLPSDSGEQPSNIGILELSTHNAYGTVCRQTVGKLLPYLFTLTAPFEG